MRISFTRLSACELIYKKMKYLNKLENKKKRAPEICPLIDFKYISSLFSISWFYEKNLWINLIFLVGIIEQYKVILILTCIVGSVCATVVGGLGYHICKVETFPEHVSSNRGFRRSYT